MVSIFNSHVVLCILYSVYIHSPLRVKIYNVYNTNKAIDLIMYLLTKFSIYSIIIGYRKYLSNPHLNPFKKNIGLSQYPYDMCIIFGNQSYHTIREIFNNLLFFKSQK